MKFGTAAGYIVTLDENGNVPMNARIVAKLDEGYAPALDAMLTQANDYDRLLALNKELVEELEHVLDNSRPINGGPFYIYDEYRYTQKVQDQVRDVLAKAKP